MLLSRMSKSARAIQESHFARKSYPDYLKRSVKDRLHSRQSYTNCKFQHSSLLVVMASDRSRSPVAARSGGKKHLVFVIPCEIKGAVTARSRFALCRLWFWD